MKTRIHNYIFIFSFLIESTKQDEIALAFAIKLLFLLILKLK